MGALCIGGTSCARLTPSAARAGGLSDTTPRACLAQEPGENRDHRLEQGERGVAQHEPLLPRWDGRTLDKRKRPNGNRPRAQFGASISSCLRYVPLLVKQRRRSTIFIRGP